MPSPLGARISTYEFLQGTDIESLGRTNQDTEVFHHARKFPPFPHQEATDINSIAIAHFGLF